MGVFYMQEFLSEEDLDLKNLTWDELMQYCGEWLEAAQATNELDKDLYSHSAFLSPVKFPISNP